MGLQLETRHLYTDGETQLALRIAPALEIPFSRLYENTITFGPLDYAATASGGTPALTNRLDAQHPASRLLWFQRAPNDLRAGRRWKTEASNSTGEYTTNVGLFIAGRDRETVSPNYVWSDLAHHAKEEKDPGLGFYEMNWDLGAVAGRRAPFYERQPEGSVNFTTADRPTLYTELAAIPADAVAGKPKSELTAVVDSWALYRIEPERGFLKYGN